MRSIPPATASFFIARRSWKTRALLLTDGVPCPWRFCTLVVPDMPSLTCKIRVTLLSRTLDLASEVCGQASADLNERILGGLSKKIMLPVGGFAELNFVVSWHFPRYSGGKVFFSTMETIPKLSSKQRYYATKFSDSLEVARYVERHFERLSAATKLWVSTWYDTSLPRWFMDRTFINTSILATQTAHRFEDGRFYGWEGVDSCPGNLPACVAVRSSRCSCFS